MKKYKDIGVYDFSDYAEEITGNALFKINGGAQIENSIEAQANAKVGDTVTREDGTTHTLYQGDIDWAQKEMDSRTSSVKKENVNQGNASNTNSENKTSENTENTQNDSASSSTDISSPNLKKQNNWTFNPNEPDTEKRYNAKEVKYKNKTLYVMTINCDDAENFESFLNYYVLIGKDGAAGTTVYDGIGLMDKNGNVIQVLEDEKSVKKYAEYLASSTDKNINVMDVVGGISTATGISADILNYIDTGAKASNVLGKISTATGLLSIGFDANECRKNPSFSKACDVVIDGIGFIPDGGALLSLGLSVEKEKLEKETSAAIASYKDYKIKDTLYKFVPSQNNDIFFDQDYFFMKGVSNQIKEIFRGN